MKTHRAILRKQVESFSDIGTQILVWQDQGQISGHMDLLTITKGEIAQKIVEDSTHIFIAFTNANVEQGDRLYVNGKGYEVNFVDRPMYGKQAEIELKPLLKVNEDLDVPIYYGVKAQESLDDLTLYNLDSEPFPKKSFTKTIEMTDGNLFIAYPKSFGNATIRLNHKPVFEWELTETMLNGYLYNIYKVAVEGTSLHIELF